MILAIFYNCIINYITGISKWGVLLVILSFSKLKGLANKVKIKFGTFYNFY